MKIIGIGRLIFYVLIYLVLMAGAFWYFNKDKNNVSDNNIPNLNTNLNTGFQTSNGLANTTGSSLNNDPLNPAQSNNPPVVAVNTLPNLNNQQSTNSNTNIAAANQFKTASIARQYHDSSVYANHQWRGSITYPTDKALVNSEQGGWVTVHGKVSPSRLGETLFVVVESTTQDPPKIYLQRELQLADDGFWTANVKYGSLGYEYITYVISAPNDLAANAIRQLGEFTQDQLPAGTEIISRPSINLIQ